MRHIRNSLAAAVMLFASVGSVRLAGASESGDASAGWQKADGVDASFFAPDPLDVVALVDQYADYQWSSESYVLAGSDGRLITLDGGGRYGYAKPLGLRSPVVGYDAGYYGAWLATADGGVITQSGPFQGSAAGLGLKAPIVGIKASSLGFGGYWLVAADGGVFTFGSAQFHGSAAGLTNAPIVGMARSASSNGYWLVASDGGVFAFGDAQFYGSLGGRALNRPIVAMTRTRSGNGYWLVASDGGVFAFGDAQFYGSLAGRSISAPIVGLTAARSGGYALAGRDGAVYAFGGAPFFGSLVNPDVSSIVLEPNGLGVATFGDVDTAVLSRLNAVLGPPYRAWSMCPNVLTYSWTTGFSASFTSHRLSGWRFYNDMNLGTAPPPAFKTAAGITLGNEFDEIVAAYGADAITNTGIYGTFEVRLPSGVLRMSTSASTSSVLTTITAGTGGDEYAYSCYPGYPGYPG